MKNQLVHAVLKNNLTSKAPESMHAMTDVIDYLVDFNPEVAELLASACVGVRAPACDYQLGQVLNVSPKLFSQQATDEPMLVKVVGIDKYGQNLLLSGKYRRSWKGSKDTEPAIEERVLSAENRSFESVEQNIVS
jgi:hypothetical protein